MTGLYVTEVRCEALFTSMLQPSDPMTAATVAHAISQTVGQFGHGGCITKMAEEFGDHPETAGQRMRWVRKVISELDLLDELRPTAQIDPAAELALA